MIIAQKLEFIKVNFSYFIENIKSCSHYKEKKYLIRIFIGNLMETSLLIPVVKLAELLNVSRYLINEVIDSFHRSEETWNIEKRGRRRYEENFPNVINHIQEIVVSTENVDSSLKDDDTYIDSTLTNIQEKLKKEYNYSNPPSKATISRILREKLKYKLTKIKKSKTFKKIKETDQIFENVNNKLEEVKNNENTIGLSIDDKANKYIGNLSAGGKSWIKKEALDHDTNPDKIVKPFGIMNVETKETDVYCTTSNSTAEYKVNCLKEYITKLLSANPKITKIILFLDNGPENSSRRKLWMYHIIKLSIELNITIELAYYPPYHSKYNKIEHFWGVLQKHWSRLIINSLDKLIGAINGTKYNKINAKGHLKTEVYEKGKKVDEKELKKLIDKHIHHENKGIEKWSLIITP